MHGTSRDKLRNIKPKATKKKKKRLITNKYVRSEQDEQCLDGTSHLRGIFIHKSQATLEQDVVYFNRILEGQRVFCCGSA